MAFQGDCGERTYLGDLRAERRAKSRDEVGMNPIECGVESEDICLRWRCYKTPPTASPWSLNTPPPSWPPFISRP
jgi:hypothetical protein